MMRGAERRQEVVRILRGRKREKIENLAFELGVDRRTIERDLLKLTSEGYHIDTIQGHGGGVVFEDKKHPLKGNLSQEQIKVLNKVIVNSSEYEAKVLKEILEAFG